jgi:hypothetical protein
LPGIDPVLGLEDSFLTEGIDILSVGQGRPARCHCLGEHFAYMPVQLA